MTDYTTLKSEDRFPVLVDEFGCVRVKIAELSEREQELRQLFIEHGEVEYEGYMFRVKIDERVSARLDHAKVKAILTPAQLIACTRRLVAPHVQCLVKATPRSLNRCGAH